MDPARRSRRAVRSDREQWQSLHARRLGSRRRRDLHGRLELRQVDRRSVREWLRGRSVQMRALLVLAIVLASARAYAYPQFQLSKDQTCGGCHISPSGSGLLTENGMVVSEAISRFGTSPEFMYGKLKTPGWLAVGGDFRGAWGYVQAPQRYLVGFPMQAELYGNAHTGPVSFQLT